MFWALLITAYQVNAMASPRFAVRERAERALVAQRAVAWPFVFAGTKSRDPEVRARCLRLLPPNFEHAPGLAIGVMLTFAPGPDSLRWWESRLIEWTSDESQLRLPQVLRDMGIWPDSTSVVEVMGLKEAREAYGPVTTGYVNCCRCWMREHGRAAAFRFIPH